MDNDTTAAVRTCGLCCHCGQGLPYMKSYFFCLLCDLRYCNGCRGAHPPSHEPFLKWLRDQPTARGALPDEKSCMNCKKMTHCCLSCEGCDLHVCADCIVEARVSLINHEHRSMSFIRAPDDYGLQTYSHSCDSCHKGMSLAHCGRCWSGIKKVGTSYACVTCVTVYNGQVRFCEGCRQAGRAEHDPSHKFASFRYKVDHTADEKYAGVQCLDCKQPVSLSGQFLARHPHTRYQITVGEGEKDRRIFQGYRNCARKPVRDIATVSDNAHRLICQCCWQQFPANAKTFLCGTCTFIACVSCAESGGARSHPHIMFPLLLKWITPPDDLWKSLVVPGTRFCARCDKPIQSETSSYIQCNHCREWNICQDCISDGENLPVRHSCPEAVEMTYFDPVDRGKEWLAGQLSMAQRTLTGQAAGSPSSPVAAAITPSRTSSQSSFAIKRKPASRKPVAVQPVAVQSVAVQSGALQQQQQQRKTPLSPKLEQLQGTVTNTATTMANKINMDAVNSAGKKLLKGGLKFASAVGGQVLKSQINGQLQMINAQVGNPLPLLLNTTPDNPLQSMDVQTDNPLLQGINAAISNSVQQMLDARGNNPLQAMNAEADNPLLQSINAQISNSVQQMLNAQGNNPLQAMNAEADNPLLQSINAQIGNSMQQMLNTGANNPLQAMNVQADNPFLQSINAQINNSVQQILNAQANNPLQTMNAQPENAALLQSINAQMNNSMQQLLNAQASNLLQATNAPADNPLLQNINAQISNSMQQILNTQANNAWQAISSPVQNINAQINDSLQAITTQTDNLLLQDIDTQMGNPLQQMLDAAAAAVDTSVAGYNLDSNDDTVLVINNEDYVDFNAGGEDS